MYIITPHIWVELKEGFEGCRDLGAQLKSSHFPTSPAIGSGSPRRLTPLQRPPHYQNTTAAGSHLPSCQPQTSSPLLPPFSRGTCFLPFFLSASTRHRPYLPSPSEVDLNLVCLTFGSSSVGAISCLPTFHWSICGSIGRRVRGSRTLSKSFRLNQILRPTHLPNGKGRREVG